MKVNVYQMVAAKDGKPCSFNLIGTVVGESPDPETIWHLTNHGCWNHKSDSEGNTIEEEFSPIVSSGCTYVQTSHDRGYTNDDICFELNGSWYCAKSSGWKTVKTMEEAKGYLFNNATWVRYRISDVFKCEQIIDNI